MSYTIEITKVNINVPTISGDLKPDEPSDYIASSAVSLPFVVDLTFTLILDTSGQEGGGEEEEAITSVVITTPSRTGVSFTVQDSDPFNYTVRVQGVFNEVPFNTTYDIVTQGSTDRTFDLVQNVQTTEPFPDNFLAVVRWTPPPVFWFDLSGAYQIVVNGGVASTSLSQYVYWEWISGLSNFRSAVQLGVI
jgi:hypothetical protein